MIFMIDRPQLQSRRETAFSNLDTQASICNQKPEEW